MPTPTNISKHNATVTASQKSSTGTVFYAWLFWFTFPNFTMRLTGAAKHSGALTNVPKH